MPTKRCRFCLRFCSVLVPLFKASIGDKQLTELIYELFRIEFDRNPKYPQRVCEQCVKKVDYVYSFYVDLIKGQALMERLAETGSRKEARILIEAEGPSNYSDAAFDEEEEEDMLEQEVDDKLVEALEEEGSEEGAATEQMEPVLENVEIEAVGFDDDRPVEEQLIDIKIEAVDEECDFLVEKLSDDDDDKDGFKGFEEPVPIKLEQAKSQSKRKGKFILSNRKPKIVVPKLDIIETIPNKCYICSEVLEDQDHFDLHLLTHGDMLPYRCESCSTKLAPVEIKTLVLLNKHFESHGFSYVCDFCPLRFRSYPPLYDHTRNFHTEHKEGFNCDMCGQVFIEIRKFQKHVRAHRNRDSERYKCQTCGKNFQTGTILRRHEQIHMSNPLHTCDVCQRVFNNDEQFRKHKLRHLQQQHDQKNGYTCSQCQAHFTCKADLRAHLHTHFPNNPNYSIHTDILPAQLKDSSTYPRPCEEPNCKYVAPTYTLMWSHYRCHYKMYHCEECDRKFATATILKNHVEVIHRKIRKYQCELCQKTFAYQHKYKEHMNVHRGIRSHKCRFCEKTFTHSSNLLVHEKVHRNIKAHRCDICESTYVTTSALKKHRRTHRTNVHPLVGRSRSHRAVTIIPAAVATLMPEEIVPAPVVVPEEQKVLVEAVHDPNESKLIYFMEDESEGGGLHHQVEIGGGGGEEELTVKELCEVLEEA